MVNKNHRLRKRKCGREHIGDLLDIKGYRQRGTGNTGTIIMLVCMNDGCGTEVHGGRRIRHLRIRRQLLGSRFLFILYRGF